MRLKNVLIVTKDIERARQFYHDLFGLELVLDNEGSNTGLQIWRVVQLNCFPSRNTMIWIKRTDVG